MSSAGRKTGRVVARLFRLVYRNADLTLFWLLHFKEDLVEMAEPRRSS